MSNEFVLPVGPMGEWFTRADAEVQQVYVAVLMSSTAPRGSCMPEHEIDWTEFNRHLAMLTEMLRHRHAAKHAASREMLWTLPPPIVVER